MKAPFANLPIRQKFILPMVAALILMLVSTYYYFPERMREAYQRTYLLSATRMAGLLADAAMHALEQHHYDYINELLQDSRVDPNVKFIVLLDTEGSVFAVSTPDNHPPRETFSPADSNFTEIHNSAIVVHRRVWSREKSKQLASLVLSYSLESLNQEISNFHRTTIIFALIALGLGYLFIRGVSRRITRSISKLRAHMHAIIEEGHFTGRVDVDAEDEVGSLATSFNKLMRELQNRHDRLEASEQRLRSANTKLKKINRLKTVFVSDASHQLRTPLTVINGEVEVALQSPPEQMECRETLKIIGEETRSLMKIVENLLSLAKADAGNLVHLQQEIDFSEICESEVRKTRAIASQKNIEIQSWIHKNCVLNGDPNRLSELVYNLIENAIKYSPAAQRVHVTLAQTNNHYILTVADNGIGIPKEEQEKIFTRFYRADNAERLAKGTGLGLAICESIVKAHRGKMVVRSCPGEGSTFEVLLLRQV